MKLNSPDTNLLALTLTNDDNTSIGNEINIFEKDSGVILPPIFKSFIENFNIWSISEFTLFQVAIPNKNSYVNFDVGGFRDNPEIGIETMLKPSQYILAKRNVYHPEEEQEIVKDKIVIGNIFGGCLLLGHEEHNKDFIYADTITEDIENRCVNIADNILDYFRNIIVKPNPMALERLNINLKDLYRYWGDERWQIKTEESKSR